MAEPRERLFRDDAGAALERVARLEQENQELRSEIDRIQRPARETPTVRIPKRRIPQAVLGLSLGSLLIGGMMVAMASRSAPRPRYHPPPPPSVLGLATTPLPTATVTVTDVEDCETPYAYDENGVKHYKMACIHPDRPARQTQTQ